ncbi:uncharacterized protein [Ptychodera flava]|uniref:uncharacterized protein n=1 Tax=Ptychodera flava TaxID=63121 RepID=UPI00396A1F93
MVTRSTSDLDGVIATSTLTMIIRHSEDVPDTTILPNPQLQGREMIADSDNMGHTAYEVFIEAGETADLNSSEEKKLNHIYYCISGTGALKDPDGQSLKFEPHTMMALSSGMSAQLSAESRIRMYVIYCSDVQPSVDRVVFRSLAEIIGSERNMHWGQGYSRRFLLKSDGFPISLTNTSVDSGCRAKLGYQNHLESAHYITGKVHYEWEDGAKMVESRVGPNSGTTYNMDQHDKHIVLAKEESSCLCIFFPALTGLEKHDLSSGYSSYNI